MGTFHDKPELRDVRRALRRDGAPSEALLWLRLKNRQVHGHRFRRQHSIGPFVVDFYCPSERLAIELDGSVHNNVIASANDQARQEWLNAQGIRVIRFDNQAILDDLEGVIDAVSQNFSRT